MCLHVVRRNYSVPSERTLVAYKLLEEYIPYHPTQPLNPANAQFDFPFFGHVNEVKMDTWIKAVQQRINASEKFLGFFNETYLSGFHCFTEPKDATDFAHELRSRGVKIYKVIVKHVQARGYEIRADRKMKVIVAGSIYIPSDQTDLARIQPCA